MKNLKRALSFALASVMLIGMMAVSASAKEFTDAEQIEHDEAVATLVSLNVVSGKEDGSYYDPTAVVTRGEMAKMVTVALNGGKDPVLNTNAVPTFTDIKGHWAEKYIEYCYSLNIIAGRGDGTFDPYGTVTGVEAAKMMLVAQGWDSKIFGFTGASWAANVNIEANRIELYDQLSDIEPSEGLTRDDAAQLIYNGILAPIMEKSPAMTVTGQEITWDYTLEENKSIFTEYYKGKTVKATFTGNSNTNSVNDGHIVITGLTYKNEDGENQTANTANFPFGFDIQYIGEEVEVLFRDNSDGTAYIPDKYDTIFGVNLTGGTSVIRTTVDKINEGYEKTGKVEIDEVEYEVLENDSDNNTLITWNYDNNETKALNVTNIEALSVAKGDAVKFILNDDNKVIAAYVVEDKIAAVTAVNGDKITMNNGVGTIEISKNEVYEDVEKGDVVVVTTLYVYEDADADKAYNIVELAEVVTGTVDGYNKTEKVTVDGTTYKLYDKAMELTAIPNETPVTEFGDDDIGEEFDVYMVNGYVGAAIQLTEAASNYSVVLSVKPTSSVGDVFAGLQIQVMDAEGTKTVLTLNDDSKDAAGNAIENNTGIEAGDIVTWTGSADDAKVTVETAWDDADTSNYYDSTKSFNSITVADNAVLFIETKSDKNIGDDGHSIKAYALRGLGNITNVPGICVTNKAGDKVLAVVMNGTAKPKGAVSNVEYGIISADNGVVKIDGDPYHSYVVENDTDTYTINISTSDTVNVKKGNIVAFAVASDNVYDATTLWLANTENDENDEGAPYVGCVKEYNSADNTLAWYNDVSGNEDDGYVGAGTTYNKAVADDCKIVYVDIEDDKGGADIGVNAFDTVEGHKNVIVIVDEGQTDDEDKVVAIIVETSNDDDITA